MEEIIQGKLDYVEDKFGWTMRFLLAAEEANPGRMERCAAAYPHLKELVETKNHILLYSRGLAPIRAHAVELAKNEVVEGLHDLKRPHWDGDEQSLEREITLSQN